MNTFIITFGCVFAIGLLFWLFAIKPGSNSSYKPLQILKNYDYAHRGFWDRDLPENSVGAFIKAVDNGFGIELDVQLTKDGEVVVFHDSTLKRMCGEDKLVSELTYNELQGYNLLNTDEKIPLFTKVLDNVKGRTPIIVEIKYYKNLNILCQKVNELLKNYNGPVCIESFSPTVVKWFKKNNPNMVRGQLLSDFRGKDSNLSKPAAFIARNLLTSVVTRPNFIAYDCRARSNISLRTCKALYKAQEVSWTVRNKELYNKIKAEGALIIFEHFDPRVVD